MRVISELANRRPSPRHWRSTKTDRQNAGRPSQPRWLNSGRNIKEAIDATTNGMVIGLSILCVAPNAGRVTIKSLIPVNRVTARVSVVAGNV